MDDIIIDALTTEIPWSRPPCRLGNLSGPDGNALIVLGNIKNA